MITKRSLITIKTHEVYKMYDENPVMTILHGRGGVYEKMCYLNPNHNRNPEWELGVKGLIGT